MDNTLRNYQTKVMNSNDLTSYEKNRLVLEIFKRRIDLAVDSETKKELLQKQSTFKGIMDSIGFSPAYKKFNQADRLLERLWMIFPLLDAHPELVSQDNQIILLNNLNSLITKDIKIQSNEFCHLINNNKLKLMKFEKGGFGTVNDFKIDEDEERQDIKAIITSIKQNGGFEPFYCPVIIKTANEPTIVEWGISKNPRTNVVEIQVVDPLTEMVFGSMLGHFYDLGICPFYSKFFGIFSCNNDNMDMERPMDIPDEHKFYMASEKSTIELRQFINPTNNPDRFLKIKNNPGILLNIIFQFIYSIYVGKYLIGFTHFDLHHRNMLITFTDCRKLDKNEMKDYEKINKPIQYIYQGKDMKDIKYIIMNSGLISDSGIPIVVIIKYNGLMCKMIDFGACASFMSSANDKSNYKRNYTFVTKNLTHNGSQLAYKNCNPKSTDKDLDKGTSSFRNTTELLYLLTALSQDMETGCVATNTTPTQSSATNKELIDSLEKFTSVFFNLVNRPGISALIKGNPDKGYVKNDNGTPLGWLPQTRDMGMNIQGFDESTELMNGLIRYCKSLKHVVENAPIVVGKNERKQFAIYYLEPDIINCSNGFTPENSLYLDVNSFINRGDVNKTLTNIDKIKDECDIKLPDNPDDDISYVNKPNSSTTCVEKLEEIQRHSAENTLSKPLYNPISTEVYDSKSGEPGELKSNININKTGFEKSLRIEVENKLEIYSIVINPEALKLNRNRKSSLVYKNYQNWLDYNEMKKEKVGKYKETVNLNIIVIKNGTSEITLNHGMDLWKATSLHIAPTVVTINGGYFIVNANGHELTSHKLKPENIGKPLGFSYDKNNIPNNIPNGTYLAIPKPYRKYFGVVKCKGNVISISTHNDFMSKHETINEVVKYLLEDGSIYDTNQPVIKMDTDNAIGRTPVLKAEFQNWWYDWAFCSGPMLVFNKNVVFDLDTMLNTQFTIDKDDTPALLGISHPRINSTYRLLPDAPNNFMFRTEATGDASGAYGSRHSNRIGIHSILATNGDGDVISFMVEGRGYDAPGLDRVQVANLVHKFNIVNAISLDGGFSANAVFKVEGREKMWLQSDPEKRKVGLSISFSFL